MDINASLVQANDANTKLTFTASGNLDLGAFEMGTKYDYASTAGSATNLTMGAARRLLFYGDDNKIQPNGWVELCTNFRLPYANGTTLIYDPEMIIPFRAPSTIDGTPLGWFVFAAGIGVAMLLVKKRVR